MRGKKAWKELTVLIVILVAVGVLEAHIELMPGDAMQYVEGAAGIPQAQVSADGQTFLFVNACQTYAFIAFYFVGLIIAHNLVLMRTPMMLVRYRTWRTFQKSTFARLMIFSLKFLVVTTALLIAVEQILALTPAKQQIFVAHIVSPKAMGLYLIHMTVCTAMVCLYQVAVMWVKRHILVQVFPLLFFIGSGTYVGTFIQQISPFSFPVYDRIPEGGLLRVILTYVICFAILLFVCRKPKQEYLSGEKV